ncbi:hypothetical protein FH972_010805 [Carpinus fangiana]|uniref:NAD-dependent epimerase/dehydratase domain-containing protein n=1 Tax=Carpinus fangiana TaxID=176857 RepID=A0A660KRE7_9ROSI|nr:hypothetical protein FH972_010805 [Carpinus fangiana]
MVQSEIIDPAVKGTLNVLRSCAKVPSIKRVIITSSMTSVSFNRKPLTPDVVVDETWFSDPVMCKEEKRWYHLSKTLAEEAAWKFAEECGIDLVVINPGFVIGPVIQPTPTFSIDIFLKLLNGNPTFPGGIYRCVDVRDVAHAHIQAFEIPAAGGRYCLVERTAHYFEFFKILHKLYPSLHLPEKWRLAPSREGASSGEDDDVDVGVLVEGGEGFGEFGEEVAGESVAIGRASEIIDPAVKGTLNVLRSCAKVPSIKRVIITSSMASVSFSRKPLTLDVVVDETWFSDPVMCKEEKLWYHLSKTLAEEAAWKFAEECGIDLVVINPGFVIGPVIQPTPTSSIDEFLKLVNGNPTFPGGIYRCVDVRDVAHAHIQAFEIAAAGGRYCLVERIAHHSEFFKILHKLYPSLHLPEKFEDDKPLLPVYKVSQDKAKSLGISFTPLEVTLGDTIESLKEKGFLTV